MIYSEAIKELESITNKLQNNEIAVDKLQENVKRAAELMKFCKTSLIETNKEIQTLISQFEEE